MLRWSWFIRPQGCVCVCVCVGVYGWKMCVSGVKCVSAFLVKLFYSLTLCIDHLFITLLLCTDASLTCWVCGFSFSYCLHILITVLNSEVKIWKAVSVHFSAFVRRCVRCYLRSHALWSHLSRLLTFLHSTWVQQSIALSATYSSFIRLLPSYKLYADSDQVCLKFNQLVEQQYNNI